MTDGFTILVIDDEPSQLVALTRFLRHKGYTVLDAPSGRRGIELATLRAVDLVITDFRMSGMDGLAVLRAAKAVNPDIEVVVLTAYGNVQSAVSLMKEGAYDYLAKPVDLDELSTVIARVREKRALVSENRALKEQLAARHRFDAIISGASAMEEVLSQAARAAPTRSTVLIRGESGTGKELVARAIHEASPRRDAAFEVVHAAAFNEELVESELFGHEKGAFTGAFARRIGRLERAHGGTLFLDEVGDIPPSIQVKLLRAIQFGEYTRVGSSDTLKVDARIVAATHRDLEAMIRQGTFREDLFYRLNVVTLWIPPLRSRRSDIPALANHFLGRYAERHGKPVTGFSREAMDLLMKYAYPGNVRELENLVERAVVLTRDDLITTDDLPVPVGHEEAGLSAGDARDLTDGFTAKLRRFELEMIDEALARTEGNKSAAARLLGISERHLRYRMNRKDRVDGAPDPDAR